MSTAKPTLPKPMHKMARAGRRASAKRPRGWTPAGEECALARVQRWVRSNPDRSPLLAPGHIQEKMALIGRTRG